MRNIELALDNFDQALEDLIEAFCFKQGIEFDFFIDSECGLASFNGNLFFELTDIHLDLSHDIPNGYIIDYHNSQLNNLGISEQLLETYATWLINYKNLNIQ